MIALSSQNINIKKIELNIKILNQSCGAKIVQLNKAKIKAVDSAK